MAFRIHRDIEIQAPPEVVWEVLTDFPSYSEWNRFVVRCESTLKPGDPIDLRVNLGAKPRLQREWVKACTPGKGFSYAMKPVPLAALSSKRSHLLEPQAGGTLYRSHFELRGWLAPLVKALMGRKLHQGFSQMNEGVRVRSEKLWRERNG